MATRRKVARQPSSNSEDSSDSTYQVLNKPKSMDFDLNKVYGKTFNGKVFSVPKTYDLLHTFFKLDVPKTVFTHITMTLVIIQLLLFFLTPINITQPLFLVSFLFWRLLYNGFLGYLLYQQSNNKFIIKTLDNYRLLDTNTFYGLFIKNQLIKAMGKDYDYDSMPKTFNAWLLYRELVDLILINDFISYLLFSLSMYQSHSDWSFMENLVRYTLSLIMIGLNIVIKMDALRVVKDFAWYWGDFFFLIDQELTFDGVFELTPHPMYSLGYVGYYGVSLLMGSSLVFYISLLAHACQFIFLIYVENPHIEKIYPSNNKDNSIVRKRHVTLRNDAFLFKGWDLYRHNDLVKCLMAGYGIVFCLIGLIHQNIGLGDEPFGRLAIVNALGWRFVHMLIIGFYILGRQSVNQSFTKHYIKLGYSLDQCFDEWKAIYNLISLMTYTSFFISAILNFNVNQPFLISSLTLRSVFGILLICLNVWTSSSVYESLGEFGWFYGDFFILNHKSDLKYDGIYRYLNNPEKIIGHSGLYGLALISGSNQVVGIALISNLAYLLFYNFIESPHMLKRYGPKLRVKGGVSKTVDFAAKQINSKLKDNHTLTLAFNSIKVTENLVDQLTNKVNQSLNDAKILVADLVDKTKPKLNDILNETVTIMDQSKIKIVELRERLTLDLKENEQTDPITLALSNQIQLNLNNTKFIIGQPIHLIIKVPTNTSNQLDWVGLYPIRSNPSSTITTASSKGKFLFTHPPTHKIISTEFDEESVRDPSESIHYNLLSIKDNFMELELIFFKDKLPYKPDTYEFRFHLLNGYKVIKLSKQFQIVLPSPHPITHLTQSNDVVDILTNHLSTWCNPNPIENSIEIVNQLFESNELTKSMAKGLSRLILSTFDIEFHYSVILSLTTIQELADKILEAHKALTPSSIQK